MGGLSWLVVFAVLAAVAYYRSWRSGALLFWGVMFGIFLGSTTLGQWIGGLVTGGISTLGQFAITSFNSAVG